MSSQELNRIQLQFKNSLQVFAGGNLTHDAMKQQTNESFLLATEWVWAKSLMKEQSDLTHWGMDQQGQGWHTTAVFNSSLLGQWMQLSIEPPAAEWTRQNPICYWVTLPFSESYMEPHIAHFRSKQGCYCESIELLLTPEFLMTPVSLRNPCCQSVQWVAARGAMHQFCRSVSIKNKRFILQANQSTFTTQSFSSV